MFRSRGSQEVLVHGWGQEQGSGGTVVNNPPANAGDAGDMGSIPWSGSSPGGGNCNPLQYSSLENPIDKGAWWATVHGKEPEMTEGLSMHKTHSKH